MLSFTSDYIAAAHPRLLDAITLHNLDAHDGYGADLYCAQAADRIRTYFGCPEGEVFFLTGGTQVNQFVISTMLRSYEGVVAAGTGHIALHEAGAIEYAGHKVLTLPAYAGKLRAEDLRELCERFYADGSHEHMVFPGMVYLSYPTEYGTLYTADELRAIRAVCRDYDLPLFIDGARLAYGLASADCDLTPAEFASLCDVFYAGGTKCGALLGEALIYPHGGAPAHFQALQKQRGALLAKSFLLGMQFSELFADGLYEEIGRTGNKTARALCDAFREKGYTFFLETPTNQQFVVLENRQMEALSTQVGFTYWEPYDANHTVVRFATSWATTPEQIEQLRALL